MPQDERRRSITELIARYSREPSLKEIYVEGKFDKIFIELFLKKIGCKDTVVYLSDTIDINRETLESYGIEIGNRGRQVALSLILEAKTPNLQCIAVVLDSDCDFLFGRQFNSKYLLFTDYTSLDLYYWTENMLEKLFRLGLRNTALDAQKVYQNMSNILIELFLIRCTNYFLKLRFNWIQFVKFCKINQSGSIEFDAAGFTENYLKSNSYIEKKQEFNIRLLELKKKVNGDKRCFINIEDLIELLAWYTSENSDTSSSKLRSPDEFRKIFYPMIEFDSIIGENLFSSLIRKYN
jgi:hypothetical protein